MSNYKTIALTGAETEVKISGQNCDIRNDGTDTVYAGGSSGVVAGADGVASIPAGQAVKLLDTNGTVYLLGTGSVLLCGNDYAEPVFKSAASASSGGGTEDTVARNAINTHAANGEIHLTAEKAIEAAATTISNPNILINSWFGKGVINQRGQTEYNANNAYTVDQWKLWKYNATNCGTVEVTDDGVLLTSSGEGGSVQLSQALERADLVGQTVTISCEVADVVGTWILYQHGASPRITITEAGVYALTTTWADVSSTMGLTFAQALASPEASCKLKWIKLELGSVATQFVAPNPATELAKCQRYFYALPYGAERFSGFALSTTTGYLMLPLPTAMRDTPTVTRSDGQPARLAVANGENTQTVDTFTVGATPLGLMYTVTGTFSRAGQVLSAFHTVGDDGVRYPTYISAEL